MLAFVQKAGLTNGMMLSLPSSQQTDIAIHTMLAEAVKTSEIEGEYFSREDVMSSIKNNMGLNPILEKVKDKRAAGIGEMMVDVRNSFAEPLTESKLFLWHRLLMQGNKYVQAGGWRSDTAPMQIISGTVGKEKVHFEAPPSHQVPQEMKRFIGWFNSTAPFGHQPMLHAPVRAAIAHLYFESIHPFEDGNGRIGRAIAEKAISQTLGQPALLSLSQAIETDKKQYYQSLQENSKHNNITSWIRYFVCLVLGAQSQVERQITFVLKKTRFFDTYEKNLNPRQLKVLKTMLEYGENNFTGGINSRKYVSIAKCSKATATRDLQELAEKNILTSIGSGRSTRYEINM